MVPPPHEPTLHIDASQISGTGDVISWNGFPTVEVGGAGLPKLIADEPHRYVRFGTADATTTKGNYLDFGTRIWNTGPGFTAIGMIRFYETKRWQRWFDFGNGATALNILWAKQDLTVDSIRFEVYDNIRLNYNAASNDVWMLVVARVPNNAVLENWIDPQSNLSGTKVDVSGTIAEFNVVQNGGMSSNASGLVSTSDNEVYVVDSWLTYHIMSSGAFIASQVLLDSGMPEALEEDYSSAIRIQVENGVSAGGGFGGYIMVGQIFDEDMTSEFGWGTAGAKPIAVTFWVLSTSTTNFSVIVRTPANRANGRTFAHLVNVKHVNMWQKVNFAIPGNTSVSGDVELFIVFATAQQRTSTPADIWSASVSYDLGAPGTPSTFDGTVYVTGVKTTISRTLTNNWIGKSNWNNDSYSCIDIRESIFYDRGLTNAELSNVVQYMRSKYVFGIVPETGRLSLVTLGSLFGTRGDGSASLIDYLPSGQFASNINFSDEEIGKFDSILDLRGKGKMRIYDVNFVDLLPQTAFVSWTGEMYSYARIQWQGGSVDVPFGAFGLMIDSLIPGSENSIQVTPISIAQNPGDVASSRLMTTPLPMDQVSVTDEVLTYNLDAHFGNAVSYSVTRDLESATKLNGSTLHVQSRNRNRTHVIEVTSQTAYHGEFKQELTVVESIDPALIDKTLVAYSLNFSSQADTKKDLDYDTLLALYPVGTYFTFYGKGMISPDTTQQYYLCRARFNSAENQYIRNTTIEYTRDDGDTWTLIPDNTVPNGIPVLNRDGTPIMPYTIYVEEYEYPPKPVPKGDLWTKTAAPAPSKTVSAQEGGVNLGSYWVTAGTVLSTTAPGSTSFEADLTIPVQFTENHVIWESGGSTYGAAVAVFEKTPGEFVLHACNAYSGGGVVSVEINVTSIESFLGMSGTLGWIYDYDDVDMTWKVSLYWNHVFIVESVPTSISTKYLGGPDYGGYLVKVHTMSYHLNDLAMTPFPNSGQQGQLRMWNSTGTDNNSGTVRGLDAMNYRTYYETVVTGNGTYTVWANSVYGYNSTPTYGGDERSPSGVFDKLTDTNDSLQGWASATQTIVITQDSADPPIIGIKMPQKIVLHRYMVRGRVGAEYQAPSKWDIQGSMDGKKWVSIDSRFDETDWSSEETREYAIPVNALPAPYTHYRMIIHRNNSTTPEFVSLGEWKLYSISPYRRIVTRDLALYYDPNDPSCYPGTGTTLFDLSGNNNGGTLQGGAIADNKMVVLNGAPQYVSTSYIPNLDNYRTYTFELWFWDDAPGLSSETNTALITNYGPNNTTANSGLNINNDGTIRFSERNANGDGESVLDAPSVCTATWIHIVKSVTETRQLLYIDGVQVSETGRPGGVITSTMPIVIGGNHLGRYQTCRLGPIRIYYDRALSSAEILQNYNVERDALLGRLTDDREYPPPGIARGDQWTKLVDETVTGIGGIVYRKYRTTVSGQEYGDGVYTAWANSIYSYKAGDGYNSNEWPPSGAFDKLGGGTGTRRAWHTYQGQYLYNNTQDANPPPMLGIDIPNAIFLHRYALRPRSDGVLGQVPSKWVVQGSVDGVAEWVTLDSRSNEFEWTSNVSRMFHVSNPVKAYKHYRITMYRNNSSNNTAIHLAEWQLFGVPVVVP